MEEGFCVGGGRYRLLHVIGRGGTARVWLGESLPEGKRLAVKELCRGRLAELPGKPRDRGDTELLAELRLQKKLFHPALPHIWDVWEEKDKIYVAMDYVEGIPLDRLLREQGARPPEQAVEWCMQLCRALVYLHSFHPPVIYRDMKPANIILQEDGKLKLVDFGTARQYRRWKRRDTMPLGTPGYAAPEQYRGRQSDVRTDVYCLGVTLYQMLTGHDPGEPPYRICRIRKWNRELSPRLERIVGKCTARDPRRRYGSCEKLLKDLEAFQEKRDTGIFEKIWYFIQNMRFQG